MLGIYSLVHKLINTLFMDQSIVTKLSDLSSTSLQVLFHSPHLRNLFFVNHSQFPWTLLYIFPVKKLSCISTEWCFIIVSKQYISSRKKFLMKTIKKLTVFVRIVINIIVKIQSVWKTTGKANLCVNVWKLWFWVPADNGGLVCRQNYRWAPRRKCETC